TLGTVSNVPAGLTASLVKASATTATLTLTGNATSHANANDSSNLTVTFADGDFTGGSAAAINDATKSNLEIDFNDFGSLSYGSTTFSESDANDGSIATTATITLSHDTFTGAIGSTLGTVSNVPAGLTAVLMKTSATTATLSLTGRAAMHADKDDVATLTVAFGDRDFGGGNAVAVIDATQTGLVIDFADPKSLSYSATTFAESGTNDGSIVTISTITLLNDCFVGAIGASLGTVSHVPAGLTAVLIKTSETTATLSLTGRAVSHQDQDGVTNLTVNFLDSDFSDGRAAVVENSTQNHLVVDFTDPKFLSYSTTTMTESVANDGSISSVVTITLTNETFSGVIGADLGTVANVPAGLAAVLIKTSATTATLTLTGNASSHANANDINDLTVTFADGDLTGGSAAAINDAVKGNLKVDFNDSRSLSYSATTFSESDTNDGSIVTTATITLSHDTFSGEIGSTLGTVSSVPAGLTAALIKTSATTATLSLTGRAVTHADKDDVTTLTVNFGDRDFDGGNALTVINATQTGLVVDFADPKSLSYSTTTFAESGMDDGFITTVSTITLLNDRFVGAIGASLGMVSNVPAGLTAVLIKTSETTATLSLTGKSAAHTNDDDSNDLTVTFGHSDFVGGNASAVENSTQNHLVVDFSDPKFLSCSAMTMTESAVNDGSISSVVTVTLTNDTFTGAIGSTLGTVSNVPIGLTAVLIKISGTTATLTLTGNASSHTNANDSSNLTVTFADGDFAGGSAAGVTNSSRSDLVVDFADPKTIEYSATTFTESAVNDGSVGTVSTITLVNDTFTGAIGSTLGTVSNVPAGLTAVLIKTSATTATLTLTGYATNHGNTDDMDHLTVIFGDGDFSSGSAVGVTHATREDLAIDFDDPRSLSYSTASFGESNANDGSIANTMTITLHNDTFTGAVGGSLGTVAHVPAGLTAILTKTSATTATLSLTGKAARHTQADDISNLTVTFSDDDLSSGRAAGVASSSRNNLVVDFADPGALSYSATTFVESEANDGSIVTVSTITLANDTFTGAVGGTLGQVTHVPTGLTAVLVKTSATTAILSLTGRAVSHTNTSDINNLTVTFGDGDFNGSRAASVIHATHNTLVIDFIDPKRLSYGASTFVESGANDGSIATVATITLVNDTFAGAIGSALGKVMHVPDGLTAILVKASATTAMLSFTGHAATHTNASDINNLTVMFADGDFDGGRAATVANAVRNNLVVDFSDPRSLSYSSDRLIESESNDGSIATVVTMTLTNDTFTGAVGASLGTVTYVPAGLTATLVKTSATTATLTLTGRAVDHANRNDTSDLTVSFADHDLSSGRVTGVTGAARHNLMIDFDDPRSLSYSATTFTEAATNDGSIATVSTIMLINDTFTGAIGSALGQVTHVPAGLAAILVKTSETTASLRLAGRAMEHTDQDDVNNLTVIFGNGDFSGGRAVGVTDATKRNLVIDFYDPRSISYSNTTFVESTQNDGSMTTVSTLTLLHDTFTGAVGSPLGQVTHVPDGLTAVLVKSGPTTATLKLIGRAINHEDQDDVANLTVVFRDHDFSKGHATSVINVTNSHLVVDFADPMPFLAYDHAVLVESNADDGSIAAVVTITLHQDRFTGAIGGTLGTVNHVPAGLTAILTKISDTTATLRLTGHAVHHTNSDDINNLTVTFADGDFAGGRSDRVAGAIKSNLVVDFNDSRSLSYSETTFVESAANSGAIVTVATITLTNDTFTGAVGSALGTVTNVPAGLTAVLIKTSATTATLSLVGLAAAHANVNDISNLTVTFVDSDFNGGHAATVMDATRDNLVVDFSDPAPVVVVPPAGQGLPPVNPWPPTLPSSQNTPVIPLPVVIPVPTTTVVEPVASLLQPDSLIPSPQLTISLPAITIDHILRAAELSDIYTRTDGFRIVVARANEPALMIFKGIPDQYLAAGAQLSFTVPADAFVHTNPRASVVLVATQADGRPLPDWVLFNSHTGQFSGRIPPNAGHELKVKVTARDSEGREAVALFRLHLNQDGKVDPLRDKVKDPAKTTGRPGLSQQIQHARRFAA
ncbi:MAG: hypothetical protein HQL58_04895, partial [Magnetococcales bacterium]|nr:hypothetical protein [Magnetococcales bacterium]